MTWKPSRLSREQMEERRLEGGQLLKEGRLSQAEIARQLGVSRTAVSSWARRIRSGGARRLRRQKSQGRPSRLSKSQRRELLRKLKRGAMAAGFPTERWTLARIAKVIQMDCGVEYHPHYLSRLLKRWGWSNQQPIPRARERDDELVKAWLERDWPRIKKGLASRG